MKWTELQCEGWESTAWGEGESGFGVFWDSFLLVLSRKRLRKAARRSVLEKRLKVFRRALLIGQGIGKESRSFCPENTGLGGLIGWFIGFEQ